MKPSFALDLTEDGITLLHRTSRGWIDVGYVDFGDPDMGAALDYLRSTALGLSPKGITTKLIIPDSQILYLQIDAAGPDDASRRAQIEAALDGRTPYALDELVYDWTGSGSTVTVAVVARETLAEAEAFATEHRFNPVSFVARPERAFDKEPFFGPSTSAHGLLAAGDQIEADPEPVTIIAREMPRSDDPVAVAQATPAAATDAADQPTEPDLPDAPEPEPEPEPELPEPEVPVPEQPEPVLPAPEVPEPWQPELPAPDLPDLPEVPLEVPVADPGLTLAPPDLEPVSAAASQPVPDTDVSPVADASPVPAAPPPADDTPSRPVTLTASVADEMADEPEAPMAVDVPQDEGGEQTPPMPPARPTVLSGQVPPADELPPPPSAAALMAFASRRPPEGTPPRPLGAAAQPRTGSAPPAAPAASRPAMTKPAAAKPVVERPAAARPAPKFSYDDPLPPPPPRMPGDPPHAAPTVMGKAGKGLRSLGTLVTAPSIPGTRKKKPGLNGLAPGPVKPAASSQPFGSTLAAPLDASPATANVKAASQSLSRQKTLSPDAIARGLSARNLPQRGKPRYLGLILTGILLLLLALVAAWSSFYLTRADGPAAEVQAAGFDDGLFGDGLFGDGIDDEAIADGQLPGAEDEILADLQDPADLPVDVELTDSAPAEPVEVALAAELPAIAAAEPAPDTGVQDVEAAAIQPDPAHQDEIFLAGMDAPPALSDPLVLPSPAAQGDAPPSAQMPPPPFGTVYQFDADGRIVPTAEGIITPDGVMLVAGKPARVPPPRPAALEAAATTVPPAATPEPVTEVAVPVADGDLRPAETFAADPSLSAARPRLRPEGLTPDTTGDDDASLAPAEDSRFASLRPRLRSPAALAAGEASRKASEAASLAVQAAVAEAAVASADDASLSPLAVSVSRVPAPRPRDLSRAVEAAVAAATRRAEPEVAAAAPAALPKVETDEADDEPEVATAAPRIPTRANVAKQATFVNAINLSKINLIGVYGTQSKRYALVRQPNGRYRKVRVGDNIDGGRVQAITASEVRYQKGGRMLALSMPSG